MRYFFIAVIYLVSCYTTYAQQDSLFAELRGDKWVILHEAELGEDILTLAKQYHVPPAILADENHMNFQDGIEDGTIIYIPFNKYNQAGAQPFDINATKKVFYVVGEHETLYAISKYAGVPQHVIQGWNKLADNNVEEGQVLFAGWVKYNKAEISSAGNIHVASQPAGTVSGIRGKGDSVIVITIPKKDTLSEIEREYLSQTNDGLTFAEEKGTVAFFNSAGKVRSSDTYYAFYNGAPKGTVVRVYNPGTDKAIYVKVLGPLPETKQYHNAIMGLGSVAKDLLGVTGDNKAWCELQHAIP